MKEPPGAPHKDWVDTIPNDGLIYYNGLLNSERIIVTSPQALSEVLTTKSYDFIKPSLLRNGLGRLLGVGILLAEGDEHKVKRISLNVILVLTFASASTQKPYASFCISSYQRSLSHFLG